MAAPSKDKPRFPRLIICEGPEDVLFFHQLIETRNLPRCHIWHSGVRRGAKGGNTKFASAIKTFELGQPKTFRSLGSLLIAADNDDDPSASFANVCAQIEDFFGAGTAPKGPLQNSKTKPPVKVLMIPSAGTKGHLEVLCYAAADNADRTIGDHVDTFMANIGADKWGSDSRIGKAWLRANLAARCVNDPFVPLGVVFTERRHENLIPLNHQSFDEVASVIANLGNG